MTIISDYTTRLKHVQETVSTVSEARGRDAKALLGLVPTPGNGLLQPGEAIDQNRRIAKRLVDVNVEYVKDLAGAVRKHVTGLAGVVKDEVSTSLSLANHQAEKIEEVAVQQAHEIQLAERAEVRRTKKIARDAAAERYEDMTKVELSEELARRDMPKTGNVDELRDRLIESDLLTA